MYTVTVADKTMTLPNYQAAMTVANGFAKLLPDSVYVTTPNGEYFRVICK